jgi:hypothetical protein
MADLWIGNLEPDTSEDEIKEFLAKYGFPAFDAIHNAPGTGARPAVVLTFNDVSEVGLRQLQSRVHDVFWKGRAIVVQVMPPKRQI